jgi:hypothetical protein
MTLRPHSGSDWERTLAWNVWLSPHRRWPVPVRPTLSGAAIGKTPLREGFRQRPVRRRERLDGRGDRGPGRGERWRLLHLPRMRIHRSGRLPVCPTDGVARSRRAHARGADSWTSTVLAFDAVLPAAFKAFLVVTGAIGGTGGDDVRLLLVNASVPPWTVQSIPLHVPGGARARAVRPRV